MHREMLLQDLRFAVRSLRHSRGFALSKQDQRLKDCLGTLVSEAERRRALATNHPRALDRVQGVFADRTVVADSLDVEERRL